MTTYMRRVLKYDSVSGEFSVSMMVVVDDDANMNTVGLDSGDPATVVIDGRPPVQFELLTRAHIFTVQLAGGGTQNVSMAGFVDPATGDSYFAPTGSFDVRTIASIDLYNEGLTTIFAEAYADYGFITVTPGAPGNNGGNHLVGTAGNDTIDALTGHDLVYGDDGDDTINGGNGQDDLYGGEGEDTLNGDANADRLFGGGDNDTLNGGAADDHLYGEDGDDWLNGGSGIDRFDGGEGSDTVDYADTTDVGLIIDLHAGLMDDINFTIQETLTSIENAVGGQLDDIFGATEVANDFDGQGGIDTVSYIYAAAGVTVYLGGASPNTGWAAGDSFTSIENVDGSEFGDNLHGDSGDNLIRGRGGDDTLIGYQGADHFDGGAGTDTVSYAGTLGAGVTVNLLAGTGAGSFAAGDTFASIENLHGSGHADTLTGNNAANVINGLAGNDILAGLGGNDTLRGHLGNDRLEGGDGDDTLFGDDGDDLLVGGAGSDTLNGGSGFDVAYYGGATTFVQADLHGGLATSGGSPDTLVSIEGVIGSAFDDVFYASAAANFFSGGAGRDTVSYVHADAAVYVNLGEDVGGMAGSFAVGDIYDSVERVFGSGFDDLLVGDGEDNYLFGGSGDDRLIGGAGADEFQGGAGTDTADYSVEASAVHVDLLANTASGGNANGDAFNSIENIIGTPFADRLAGNGAGNRLEGGGGNDTIVGGSGGDAMYGGLGIDRLYGQDGDDALHGDDGNDFIFGGIGADTVDGGAGNDTINGNPGNDVIGGGSGNDTLFGGADRDIMQGGDGDDAIYGQAGDDDQGAGLVGGLGDDLIHGGGGNDLIYGNDGADSLYGGADNDLIYGGNDADYVHGGAGNDTLYGQAGDDNMFGFIGTDNLNGGDGDDRLNGGDGNDALRGGAGNDVLNGGNHDDDLWGQGGNDRFNFDNGWGHDVINDFANDGLEKINLAAVEGIASLADLTITHVVGEALITFGSNSIKVIGIQAAQLDSSDFIF